MGDERTDGFDAGALSVAVARKGARLDPLAALLRPRMLADLLARGRERLAERGRAVDAGHARRRERSADRLAGLSARLDPALRRLLADAVRNVARDRVALVALDTRLHAAPVQRLALLSGRLEALERTRQTLGYAETLRRGYAVVRGDGAVVTSKAAAERAGTLEVEFQDGRLLLGARGPKRGKADDPPPDQGTLF